jgi:dihydroflavonol-4-reductase
VLGPLLTKNISSSGVVLDRLLNRKMPAIPSLALPAVDVRDVALAHLRSMTIPEAAGQRILLANGELALRPSAQILANQYNPLGWSVPTWSLPDWLVHVASVFDSALGLVTPLLGKHVRLSNAKAQKVLGIKFRDGIAAFMDMAASMIALGAVPDRSHDHSLSSPEAARRFLEATLPESELDGFRIAP